MEIVMRLSQREKLCGGGESGPNLNLVQKYLTLVFMLKSKTFLELAICVIMKANVPHRAENPHWWGFLIIKTFGKMQSILPDIP